MEESALVGGFWRRAIDEELDWLSNDGRGFSLLDTGAELAISTVRVRRKIREGFGWEFDTISALPSPESSSSALNSVFSRSPDRPIMNLPIDCSSR